MVLFEKSVSNLVKVFVFGQLSLSSCKVFVFGQKWLNSEKGCCVRAKSGCIRARWLYLGKSG